MDSTDVRSLIWSGLPVIVANVRSREVGDSALTWRGVHTKACFPGELPSREILLASSPREVVEILRDMPEEQRRTIAENARRRVLADHTSDHRARQVETYYAEASVRRRRKAPQLPASRPMQVAQI